MTQKGRILNRSRRGRVKVKPKQKQKSKLERRDHEKIKMKPLLKNRRRRSGRMEELYRMSLKVSLDSLEVEKKREDGNCILRRNPLLTGSFPFSPVDSVFPGAVTGPASSSTNSLSNTPKGEKSGKKKKKRKSGGGGGK